jgi:hypothetical protein
VADHAVDEIVFGGGFGLPFGAKVGQVLVVSGLAFGGDDAELVGVGGNGEAVAEVILGGDRFACVADGTAG